MEVLRPRLGENHHRVKLLEERVAQIRSPPERREVPVDVGQLGQVLVEELVAVLPTQPEALGSADARIELERGPLGSYGVEGVP